MLIPFFVWKDKGLIKVNPENVMYLEAEKNYTKVFLSNQKKPLLVRSTLTKALEQLPDDMFIQTHRSHAVSVFYIDRLERDHINIGNVSVPVGRSFYRKVIGKLNVIE